MKHWLALLALAGTPGVVFAAGLPVPAGLQWNGAPMNPECFQDFVGNDPADQKQSIDLSKCGWDKTTMQIDSGNSYTKDKKSDGYSDYEYHGTTASGAMVIKLGWSGGGSGNFTDAIEVKRDGNNLLLVKILGGGDRCNGGITDVKVAGDSVTLNRMVTPGDFPKLTGVDTQLKPYEDLEASAASCIGETRETNGKLVGFIPSDGDGTSATYRSDGEVKGYKYQVCFSELMDGVPDKKIWTVAQMKEFMRHFHRSCVEKKST